MRTPRIRLLPALALLALAACRGPDSVPSVPESAPTEASAEPAALADPVVAELGDIALTASALLRSLEFVAFTEGQARQAALPPEWETNDLALDRVVDRALQGLLLDSELDRLAIQPPLDATMAAMERYEPLRAWANMSPDERNAALARFDHLDVAHIEREVRRQAGFGAWAEARFAALPDEELHESWLQSRDFATVDLLVIPNRATEAQVDAFVATEGARIEEYYATYPGRFRQQRRALARLVSLPIQPDATPEQRATLRGQVEALRDQALVRGIEVVATENASSPAPAWAVPRDRPALFTTPVGELTPVTETGDSIWFGVAEQRIDDGLVPLDNTLRRSIARTLIESTQVSPDAAAVATTVLQALAAGRDGASEAARAGLQWQRTPPFGRTTHGSVPVVGESAPLSDAIFFGIDEPGQAFPEPVLTPEGLVVVRLVARQRPNAGQWELDRDTYRAEQFRLRRATLWPDFVDEWSDERVRRVSYELVRHSLSTWVRNEGRHPEAP